MSNETFKVGEIAIWAGTNGDGLRWSKAITISKGAEVEVIAPYGLYRVSTDMGVVEAYRYRVRVADGRVGFAKPEWLRKRRPPQDWVKLCQIDVVASGTGMPIDENVKSQEVVRA